MKSFRSIEELLKVFARVQPLVDLIHECHRGYDQEGFIE